MAVQINKIETDCYYFVYTLLDGGITTFHYNLLQAGNEVTSGEEIGETFDTERELADRVNELLGADYYESHRDLQWFFEYTILDNELTGHSYGYLPIPFTPTFETVEYFETEIQMIDRVQQVLQEYQNQ